MKKFTGGDKHDSKKKPQSKTDLVSLAMAEASKLFDKSGSSAHGNKQDAVNSAGMTIMKLMVQSKFSGTTGGKDSGGLGGLMSMVSSSPVSTCSRVHVFTSSSGQQIHEVVRTKGLSNSVQSGIFIHCRNK